MHLTCPWPACSFKCLCWGGDASFLNCCFVSFRCSDALQFKLPLVHHARLLPLRRASAKRCPPCRAGVTPAHRMTGAQFHDPLHAHCRYPREHFETADCGSVAGIVLHFFLPFEDSRPLRRILSCIMHASRFLIRAAPPSLTVSAARFTTGSSSAPQPSPSAPQQPTIKSTFVTVSSTATLRLTPPIVTGDWPRCRMAGSCPSRKSSTCN